MQDQVHILVVDDDLQVSRFCRRVLENSGCRATTANSVEQAVALLSSDVSVAFVLTDVQMPGRDGWFLAEWARVHRPDCSVGMMTGSVLTGIDDQARQSGAVGVLHKPFAPEALRRFVHSAALRKRELKS